MSLRKPKLRIGLDIGGHSIKLVAVNMHDNSVFCCRQALLVGNEMARTVDEVGDVHLRMALRKVLQDLPYRRSKIRLSMAMPFNNVFVLSLPEVEESEIKQALFWELGPLLPESAQHYEIDYQILGREKKKHQIIILVGTLLRSRYDLVLPALKSFVGEIPLLDLDNLVLMNQFKVDHPDLENPVGLLHLGATHSTYTVIAPDERPAFLVLPFGGDLLDGVLSRNRGVPLLTAEKQRREPSFVASMLEQQEEGEKEAREIWEAVVQFVSTLLRFNTRYKVQHEQPVSRIFATGGLANDILMQHVLDTPDLFLKTPCEYWEPLKDRLPPDQIDAGLNYQFGSALGIALRN